MALALNPRRPRVPWSSICTYMMNDAVLQGESGSTEAITRIAESLEVLCSSIRDLHEYYKRPVTPERFKSEPFPELRRQSAVLEPLDPAVRYMVPYQMPDWKYQPPHDIERQEDRVLRIKGECVMRNMHEYVMKKWQFDGNEEGGIPVNWEDLAKTFRRYWLKAESLVKIKNVGNKGKGVGGEMVVKKEEMHGKEEAKDVKEINKEVKRKEEEENVKKETGEEICRHNKAEQLWVALKFMGLALVVYPE